MVLARIGRAFKHEDGEGFNVYLSALPVNGEIVLRTPKDDEDQDEAEAGEETGTVEG